MDRERILAAALALLEEGGVEAVTMRAVARRLAVDPMAVYHHVGDRAALLTAAAASFYDRLDARAVARGTWQQRLRSLAVAYVRLLGEAGELLRYLTAHADDDAAAAPTLQVERLFRTAVAPLALRPATGRAAHDAFVDFLHGFALGVRGPLSAAMARRLDAELAVLLAGIEALATPRRRSPVSRTRRSD